MPPAALQAWDTFLSDLSAALANCTSDAAVVVDAGCATEPTETAAPAFRIVGGGFSFGMCFGYCITELVIDDRSLVFTRRAWTEISGDGDFPPQVFEGELTQAARSTLDDLARGWPA